MKKAILKKTNTNYYHPNFNVILITFFLIVTCSCSNDDNQPPVTITEISQEIKDLIHFKGDEKATKVLIIEQGGPSPELSEGIIDLVLENFNTTDVLTVNVHQVQTLNPSILQGNDITLNQAVNFNAESIETLSKVITYFKNEGRTVYVLGISFGAFITQEFIAKKGIDSADKYLIVSGRLDMNDIFWEGTAEGKSGFFENGITPIVDAEPSTNVFERNIARLFAGAVKNRYTQLFNTIEDLSNITYIYGATDEQVGSLTTEEVQFLESKNATILTGNGGHDEPFEGFYEQGFMEAFGIEELP